MRKEFEYLLYQYDVDFYLSGHYHSYMRSCAGLYKGICNINIPPNGNRQLLQPPNDTNDDDEEDESDNEVESEARLMEYLLKGLALQSTTCGSCDTPLVKSLANDDIQIMRWNVVEEEEEEHSRYCGFF